jgi:hypothetical protein
MPGIVGRGDHDAAREGQFFDGEVEHRRRDQTDVDDRNALVVDAAQQGFGEFGRAAARVATHRQLGAPQPARHRTSDPVGVVGAHLVGDHSANVISLEDRHGRAV